MFDYKNVKRVHIEVTDKCNASCPMCPRTDDGGPLNPHLRNIEMSLELAKKVFKEKFLKQLEFVQFCGNFGDPIVASDLLDILMYFRKTNPHLRIGIHTNGSLRSPSWWSKLGEILSRSGDYCYFGIDGLEDTNHIYRRNTSWTKIINNVKSFIASGGQAYWEYLVFKHNEHQIEDARNLARDLGFKEIFIKKTGRFFNYESGKNEPFGIKNKEGVIEDYLFPPTIKELVNPVTRFNDKQEESKENQNRESCNSKKGKNNLSGEIKKRVEEIKEKGSVLEEYESLKDYYQKTSINCMSIREGSLYISAAGEVYPCCFIGGQVGYYYPGPDGEKIKAMSTGQHLASEKSVEEIVRGSFFKCVQKSWSSTNEEKDKIGTCIRTCGTHINTVAGEYA